MISRRPGKLRRSGFLPPVMQNTSTHTMPARYRRDLGARFKTFRDNPRTFLGAPMPMRRRATRRLRLTMITGTFLFASMIVIIHVPSRALSSAPNDNHPTCTLGRWDARTGYRSSSSRRTKLHTSPAISSTSTAVRPLTEPVRPRRFAPSSVKGRSSHSFRCIRTPPAFDRFACRHERHRQRESQ